MSSRWPTVVDFAPRWHGCLSLVPHSAPVVTPSKPADRVIEGDYVIPNHPTFHDPRNDVAVRTGRRLYPTRAAALASSGHVWERKVESVLRHPLATRTTSGLIIIDVVGDEGEVEDFLICLEPKIGGQILLSAFQFERLCERAAFWEAKAFIALTLVPKLPLVYADPTNRKVAKVALAILADSPALLGSALRNLCQDEDEPQGDDPPPYAVACLDPHLCTSGPHLSSIPANLYSLVASRPIFRQLLRAETHICSTVDRRPTASWTFVADLFFLGSETMDLAVTQLQSWNDAPHKQ